MTFYCTQCWAEVPRSATRCPRCGDDIVARQARSDYTEKLIAALRHPEPTTPVRAAWILGERRERAAVEPLCRLVRDSSDAFLVESAVEALGKIGDARAAATLEWARQHPSPRVRRRAEQALAQSPARTPSDTARTKQAREETASVLTTASLPQTLDENRITTMTTTSVNESAPRETGRIGTESSVDNLAPGSEPLRAAALPSALDQLTRLAESFGLAALQPQISVCRQWLDRRTGLDVAVFGRFKAGKSSFLNHLIGRPVLPVGVVPLTAVITRLRYGPAERAEVRFLDGARRAITAADIGLYVDEKRNPENRKRVAAVEVELPELRPFAPLEFVDTPGLDSALAHNTAAALDWLPNVGAALVAVSADSPLSERDLALLEELRRQTPRVVLLLTKADLLTAAQRAEVLEFVRGQLQARHHPDPPRAGHGVAGAGPRTGAPAWPPPVFFYSIRPELVELKVALTDQVLRPLIAQSGSVAAAILRHKLLALADRLHGALEVALAAATQSDAARAALRDQLAAERRQFDTWREALHVLTREWEARAFEDWLEHLRPRQLALEQKVAQALARELAGPLAGRRLPGLLEAYGRWLTDFLEAELRAVSAAEQAAFYAPVQRARAHLEQAVRALQDRLAAQVQAALGVTLARHEFQLELAPPALPPVRVGVAFDVPLDLIGYLVPMRIFGRLVRRRLQWRARYEVRKNLSRLAAAWRERVSPALETLKARALAQAEAELAALEQSLARTGADAPALRAALAEVEAVRAALEAAASGPAGPDPGGTAGGNRTRARMLAASGQAGSGPG